MIRKKFTKLFIAWSVLALLILATGVYILSRPETPDMENFEAPGKNWNSPKKVENYFIESLNMTPEEAYAIRAKDGVDGTVDLRLNNNVTLNALVSNLYYYGFIKDEKSFRYALEHTKDVTNGSVLLKVDDTRSIDLNAEYRISEDMSAWQIADILLNRPSGHFSFDEYNYFFMP